MNSSKLFVLTASVLVLGALAWTLSRPDVAIATSPATESVPAADAGGTGPGLAAPPRARAMHAHAGPHEEGPVDQAQLLANLEQRLLARESAFLDEPVAASWAAGTETMIAGVLSQDHLASMAAPMPIAQASSCRSRTCRIELTYASPDEAEVAQAYLMGDISARLPRAQTFRLVKPEGTELVVFASVPNTRR